MYELELKIMLEAGKKAREKIMEIYNNKKYIIKTKISLWKFIIMVLLLK